MVNDSNNYFFDLDDLEDLEDLDVVEDLGVFFSNFSRSTLYFLYSFSNCSSSSNHILVMGVFFKISNDFFNSSCSSKIFLTRISSWYAMACESSNRIYLAWYHSFSTVEDYKCLHRFRVFVNQSNY